MSNHNGANALEATSDPWGDRAAVREALDRPELDFFDEPGEPPAEVPEPARRAAFGLATALGQCRLHGIGLAEDDGVLPLEIARAAARQLIAGLDDLTEIAGELGERFDWAADPIEIEDFCLFLLRDRLDAWAAFLAIDEAYAAALQEDEGCTAALPSHLEPLIQAIERYDEALMNQLDVLTIVADIPVLENWKAQLAPEYRMFLPWFLDGTIQRRAAKLERQALALAPRKVKARVERWAAACAAPARQRTGTGGSILVIPLQASSRWAHWQARFRAVRENLPGGGDTAPSRPEWPRGFLWRSPDQELMAHLAEPSFESATIQDQPWMTVQFRPGPGRDAEPLRALTAEPTLASLAGVSGGIQEENGRVYARFSASEALDSPDGPILTVGGQVWEFIDDK